MEYKTDNIEVTFSRKTPASWPPLHAARIGANHTLCGIKISGEWDYDGECDASDVECKRCLKIIARSSHN